MDTTPTTPRQAIGIETLLTRAYRDHVVDRITPEGILGLRGPAPGPSPMASVLGMLALGAAVDRSSAAATLLGRSRAMGAVDDDLIALHDAVLRLPCFYAFLTGGAGFMLWDAELIRQRVGSEAFDIWNVGTPDAPSYRIATRRHAIAAPPRRPVASANGRPLQAPAERVDGACDLYPRERREAPPSWPLHAIQPVPCLVSNGRAGTRPDPSPLVVERLRPRYAGKRKVVGHDPVWQTAPAEVALERATYATWRVCLDLLVGQLAGLARFHVLPSSAPHAPWDGEGAPPLDGLPG